MRLRGIVIVVCLFVWPALAAAQGYADSATSEHSVIRPAGYGWRNHVAVPDGPCGCPMPVRADCYDVCRPCGLRPLCFIKRVARTLDCLLPCNLCCHGGFGGPLHGCVLGNRWGHGIYSNGCVQNPAGSCFDDICGCRTSGSCTSCTSCSSAVPALSDPFQDDPAPPQPLPGPAREVRRAPTPGRTLMPPPRPTTQHTTHVRPTAPRQTAPRQSAQHSAAQRPVAARPFAEAQRPNIVAARPQTSGSPRPASPYKITTAEPRPAPATARPTTRPLPPSVLRQTSHDYQAAEPAPHWIDHAQARPLIRSQSPPEAPADLEIPYNPLRAR